MNVTNIRKKGVVTAMIAFGMIAGVVGGSAIQNSMQAHAQTATPTAAATTITPAATAPSTGSGVTTDLNQTSSTFHSNENAAHEATESPAREAQENAGQMPTVK